MANYSTLITDITAKIYENAGNDITGQDLQDVLLEMVQEMGQSGMVCLGIADGNTNPPGSSDSNIFYIAGEGTYSNFGGLTVNAGEIALFIWDGLAWVKQSVTTTDPNKADKVAGATAGDLAGLNASGNLTDSGIPADNVAQQDGYYSTLTAGTAENLVGRGTVLAEYTRRTSGGSADIGTGAATITKVHGNTLAWNQMIDNGDFSNGTTGWYTARGTIAISSGRCVYTITELTTATAGNRLEYNMSFIDGHKYYMALDIEVPRASGFRFERNSLGMGATINIPSGKSRVSAILTPNASGTVRMYFGLNDTSGTGYLVGDQFYCDNVICVDLTLAGLDNVTASEFESLFPLNYYAYNTGSLVSLTATGINTTGFNQWDEEWEVGGFNSDGSKNTSSNYRRSKNPIPVFPSTTYFYHSEVNRSIYFIPRDADGNVITTPPAQLNNTTYTTPANCHLLDIQFYVAGVPWQGANEKICINLSWSGYRNGEYEAYWQRNLSLPITSVESGGSVVFPDGMNGATSATGVTVYDALTSTKAAKRLVKVKMKDLTWGTQSDNRFYATLTSYGGKIAANFAFEQSCPKYTKITEGVAYTGSPTPDNVIWAEVLASTQSCIRVRDTSAAGNVTTFKTGLGEAEIVFEANAPTEYTLDSELNLGYSVDDFGTEEEVPQNGSTPSTAPIIYDVKYAMNAVDTLRNLPTNYISKDSLKNLLDTMQSAGIFSAYTMTYNAGTEQYTFTITV